MFQAVIRSPHYLSFPFLLLLGGDLMPGTSLGNAFSGNALVFILFFIEHCRNTEGV